MQRSELSEGDSQSAQEDLNLGRLEELRKESVKFFVAAVHRWEGFRLFVVSFGAEVSRRIFGT